MCDVLDKVENRGIKKASRKARAAEKTKWLYW